MLRIHFTAADIARTRLGAGVGPVLETAFAAALLNRGVGMPYTHWRRQVDGRLPPSAGPQPPAEALVGWAEQFLTAAQKPHLPPPLGAVWQAAVAPYWDRMTAYLEAEREVRSRIVMSGGVEQLLATLHPRLEWHAPVLEVAGAPDGDIRLDGCGVVLTPSVFLADPPARVIAGRPGHGIVLAFAAPPDAHRALWLWEDDAGAKRSLGALVGQTRAAVLGELRTTCTTSQLADKLGISAAGASQHTAVLRASGLITTRRIRNMVLHTVTPLGMALLDGLSPGPRETGRARRALPV
ncbi:ArsR/SmtB family transcription factor [Streptomyces sp. NPDC059002]|uniref:ArsR/SmtB family transcription factor n=1 Tax=Streptomyces sp. NPDC059002 TaxID=3346690 RepID=UPI00368ED4A5